jgi:hypothetical protein
VRAATDMADWPAPEWVSAYAAATEATAAVVTPSAMNCTLGLRVSRDSRSARRSPCRPARSTLLPCLCTANLDRDA